MTLLYNNNGCVPFYHCPDLGAGVAHGFSTRLGGVSPAPLDSLNMVAARGDDPACVEENFRRFCGAVGADARALVKNNQVHGTAIRAVTADDIRPTAQGGSYPADGLITNEVGVCLVIFTADCIPILFHDPVKGVIAAVHAGWRGTAGGIAQKAVSAMVEDYGCDPQTIRAAIGPGICAHHFVTRSDVVTALHHNLGEEATPFITPIAPDQYEVDLKGVNTHWLLSSGVLPQNIAQTSPCTACDTSTFWSHRIMGERRGSLVSVIQRLGEE